MSLLSIFVFHFTIYKNHCFNYLGLIYQHYKDSIGQNDLPITILILLFRSILFFFGISSVKNWFYSPDKQHLDLRRYQGLVLSRKSRCMEQLIKLDNHGPQLQKCNPRLGHSPFLHILNHESVCYKKVN